MITSPTDSKLTISMVLMTYPVASETFAVRDVTALQRAGHVVDIHQLYARGERSSRLSSLIKTLKAFANFPAKANIIALVAKVLFRGSWGLADRVKCLLLLGAAVRIAEKLIQRKPDVVHLFWGHYPSLVLPLLAGQLPHTRRSMFLGAYDLEKKLPLSRWAYAEADVLFTHARANVEDIRGFLGHNTTPVVVHRGIDLQAYPVVEVSAFVARPLRIFTAGRLIADKGFDRVIRAFALVRQSSAQATLAIAGSGPELGALQRLAEGLGVANAVDFVGWLSEDQVREQLFKTRVFLLLSTKAGERLPNAVKEGMAAGCVCISSRSPGIEELLDHGSSGYIFDADDESEVVRAVLCGLSDDSASMGCLAAATVRENFDVNVSARRYVQQWCAEGV
ncbi:glycosyltransferase [Pseudomonas viridiflava]|uniref:glycosyltransferase n=1 Tax=Pseudomonas viridiflava TaxID=33069 RepID=UPI000F068D75|nr:glycosyltransferase [Pseudomonas viridiflava]